MLLVIHLGAAEFSQELSGKHDIQPTDKCLKTALLLPGILYQKYQWKDCEKLSQTSFSKENVCHSYKCHWNVPCIFLEYSWDAVSQMP